MIKMQGAVSYVHGALMYFVLTGYIHLWLLNIMCLQLLSAVQTIACLQRHPSEFVNFLLRFLQLDCRQELQITYNNLLVHLTLALNFSLTA